MTAAFDLHHVRRGHAGADRRASSSALRMKGETVDEIAGGAASMRRHAVFIDTGGLPVVDTCGTGGDGLRHVQHLHDGGVCRGRRGVPVAKHGNRAITSECGSADVLMPRWA